jgi:hypothetical protein
MMNQTQQNRDILHVIYASPVVCGHSDYTGKKVEVIENLIPISDDHTRILDSKSTGNITCPV